MGEDAHNGIANGKEHRQSLDGVGGGEEAVAACPSRLGRGRKGGGHWSKPRTGRLFTLLLKGLAGRWAFLKLNYLHPAITACQLGKGWGDASLIFQATSK